MLCVCAKKAMSAPGDSPFRRKSIAQHHKGPQVRPLLSTAFSPSMRGAPIDASRETKTETEAKKAFWCHLYFCYSKGIYELMFCFYLFLFVALLSHLHKAETNGPYERSP